MCHHKGIGGKGTRCHCASAIKTKPAKPKKRSAEKGHGEVVGRHGLVTIAFSFPHNKCGGQGCDTGADMNDKSPSKIEGAKVPDPATYTPHPVSERVIDECCPKDEEDQISLEFKSFSKCTGNQCRSDYGKHHLKNHKCLVRDGG